MFSLIIKWANNLWFVYFAHIIQQFMLLLCHSMWDNQLTRRKGLIWLMVSDIAVCDRLWWKPGFQRKSSDGFSFNNRILVLMIRVAIYWLTKTIKVLYPIWDREWVSLFWKPAAWWRWESRHYYVVIALVLAWVSPVGDVWRH